MMLLKVVQVQPAAGKLQIVNLDIPTPVNGIPFTIQVDVVNTGNCTCDGTLTFKDGEEVIRIRNVGGIEPSGTKRYDHIHTINDEEQHVMAVILS